MSAAEFETLLVTNADSLKPFAFTLTRDNESARDLMQDTLYRAFANRDKYSVGTNIKAWLYTIMRNIFINDYRRKSRQPVVYDNTPEQFLINHGHATVHNGAEAEMGLKEVQASIHHLPEIFRNPFVLYYEGYKYNEIAALLQEPLGTIKSRIHFARKLLKEQLSRF